jgi:2-polyprenyl-3-methyl-5-hydroxy-6-metoxy-1,4-benzoquinol methylase
MKTKRRIEIITERVAGKRVLDIGCVDHTAEMEQGEFWLHGHIRRNAAQTLGLDLEADEVAKLVARGYDVVCGDAEEVDLGRTFEVVVAGELIEHLSSPGRFLRNAHRHLEPGGLLLLTTPNAFYPKRLLEIVRGRRAQVHPQHVSWYCPQTLAAAVRRAGFVDVEVVPFDNTERFRWIVDPLTSWRPWFSTNLLVSARKPADGAA